MGAFPVLALVGLLVLQMFQVSLRCLVSQLKEGPAEQRIYQDAGVSR